MPRTDVSEFIQNSLRGGRTRSEIRHDLLRRFGLTEPEVDEAMLRHAHFKAEPSHELSVDIRPVVEQAVQATEDAAQDPLRTRVIAARVELQAAPVLARNRKRSTSVDEEVDLDSADAAEARRHLSSKSLSAESALIGYLHTALRVLQLAIPVLGVIYAVEVGYPAARKWFDDMTRKPVDGITQGVSRGLSSGMSRLENSVFTGTEGSDGATPAAAPAQAAPAGGAAQAFPPGWVQPAVEAPVLGAQQRKTVRKPTSSQRPRSSSRGAGHVSPKVQRKLRSIPVNR